VTSLNATCALTILLSIIDLFFTTLINASFSVYSLSDHNWQLSKYCIMKVECYQYLCCYVCI